MLTASNLNTRYGQTRVHWDVDVSVGEGEMVGLVGPNGAGKSTLLRVLSGLHRAPGAEITFAGKNISRLSSKEIVKLGLIHVPEGRHIFGSLTVMENLQFAAAPRFEQKQFREDLDLVFELFPILLDRRDRSGAELSGGQQQMVAIARGIVARPKLLALDEPTLGLAPVIVDQMIDALKDIHERRGVSMLLLEQHAAVLKRLATRMYVMRTGRIVAEGSPDEIGAEELRRLYMGEAPIDRAAPETN